MPYALLDDEVCDHPKFARIGLDAVGLWTLALSWTSRHLTDGHIPTQIAARYTAGARRKLNTIAAELVAVNLWEPAEGGWQIHDFHDVNRSGLEQRQKRGQVSRARSAAGRKGAAARWGDGNSHSKPDGKPMANAMANGKQTDGPVPVPTKELTSSETSKSSAVSVAIESGTGSRLDDQGPILLVADVDPTAEGTCPICDCPRDRAGSHTIDGQPVICTHPPTPNSSASSTTPVTCANDVTRGDGD